MDSLFCFSLLCNTCFVINHHSAWGHSLPDLDSIERVCEASAPTQSLSLWYSHKYIPMTSKCGELNLGSLVRLNQTTYFLKTRVVYIYKTTLCLLKKKLSKLGMEQNPVLFFYSNSSSGKKLTLLIKCISNLGLKWFKTCSEKPVSWLSHSDCYETLFSVVQQRLDNHPLFL